MRLSLYKDGLLFIAIALAAQLLFLASLSIALQALSGPASQIQALQGMLRLAVLISILAAMALGFYFKTRIVERLNCLLENVQVLTRGESKHVPETGTDEIALLDQMMSAMAFDLAGAVEKEQAIADYAMDIICSLDENGRFLAVSPAAIRLWDLLPEELEGRKLTDLVPPEDTASTQKQLAAARTTAGEISFENRIACRDGALVHMSWSAEWSKTEKRLFCVGQDISVRKELDLLKQQFLALLTHDLRSPLSSIMLSMELLMNMYASALPEKARLILVRTLSEVQRLARLTNSLLDVEQIESGEFVVTVAGTTCGDIVEPSLDAVLALADRKTIEICRDYDAGTVVLCDKERMVQVFVNLLSNAIKFSPENSRITIRGRNTDSGLVRFEVVDEGPGVPADQIEQLFCKFRQLEQPEAVKKQGSGLGLYICKQLMSAQSGTIGYCPAEKQGSCFWLELPHAQAAQS